MGALDLSSFLSNNLLFFVESSIPLDVGLFCLSISFDDGSVCLFINLDNAVFCLSIIFDNESVCLFINLENELLCLSNILSNLSNDFDSCGPILEAPPTSFGFLGVLSGNTSFNRSCFIFPLSCSATKSFSSPLNLNALLFNPF